MNSITRRALLRCSYDAAVVALAHTFGDAAGGGSTPALTLQAPVRLHGLGTDIVLQRATHVEFTAAPGLIVVRWIPDPGDLFPRFSGTLAIRPDSATTCWLALDGTYDAHEQPLRALEAGERALGYRLVLANATQLLDHMAPLVEGHATCTVGALP